eukprot:scaffold177_cov334-Pavlova_lutheri.AAC.61
MISVRGEKEPEKKKSGRRQGNVGPGRLTRTTATRPKPPTATSKAIKKRAFADQVDHVRRQEAVEEGGTEEGEEEVPVVESTAWTTSETVVVQAVP